MHSRLPAVDERLAPPETRVEYIRGVEVFAAPADEPRAGLHSQIDQIVGAHLKSPYEIAVDMLTRVDDVSDFAPDVSVYEPIFDPKTKEKVGRKIEEIAFEIIDEQSLPVSTRKAMDLVARGVRRVFGVFVDEQELTEWSRKHGRWEPIPPGAPIDDDCFVCPIRAEALLRPELADDEVARALLVKRPPALQAALEESRREGLAEARERGRVNEKRRSVLRILAVRGLAVSKHVRATIESTSDLALLDRWFDEALTVDKAARLSGVKR